MLSYDSPIERIFVEACSKYLSEEVNVIPQVKIRKYRLDYVLSLGNRKIAVECDGYDFHDFSNDFKRDSVILKIKGVDTIYHFRGTDLYHYVEDCLWVMSLKDTLFFSPRGRSILEFIRRLDVDLLRTHGETIELHCVPSTRKRCPNSEDCRDLVKYPCSATVIRRTIKEIR